MQTHWRNIFLKCSNTFSTKKTMQIVSKKSENISALAVMGTWELEEGFGSESILMCKLTGEKKVRPLLLPRQLSSLFDSSSSSFAANILLSIQICYFAARLICQKRDWLQTRRDPLQKHSSNKLLKRNDKQACKPRSYAR